MEINKETLVKEREDLILQVRRIEGAIIYIDQKLAQIAESEKPKDETKK